MGSQPLGCLLGLSLPRVDAHWLASFSQAFHALADQAGCPLIGGDTTRSNQGVVISVTVFGQVDPDLALRRDAALPGDDIWVTGTLGAPRSEEHTSELQSLMRISYAVFCLKKTQNSKS